LNISKSNDRENKEILSSCRFRKN